MAEKYGQLGEVLEDVDIRFNREQVEIGETGSYFSVYGQVGSKEDTAFVIVELPDQIDAENVSATVIAAGEEGFGPGNGNATMYKHAHKETNLIGFELGRVGDDTVRRFKVRLEVPDGNGGMHELFCERKVVVFGNS